MRNTIYEVHRASAFTPPVPTMTASVGIADSTPAVAGAGAAAGGDSSASWTRHARSELRVPTGSRLTRSVSETRTIAVSTLSSTVNERLNALPGVDFSQNCLYTILYRILRETNARNATHPVSRVKSVAEFKRSLVIHIAYDLGRYIHDLVLEISEIATAKRNNRFVGAWRSQVTSFISQNNLGVRLSDASQVPKATNEILNFLKDPAKLELYYAFIEAVDTQVSDLELKAIVHLFEVNLTLFRDSLRIRITHKPRRPHIYLELRRNGLYRQIESIESLGLILEPRHSTLAEKGREGGEPFLTLTAPLIATERAGSGASASMDALLSANPSELALMKKLQQRAIKAVTGEYLSLRDLQVIIPDKFSFRQCRFEKTVTIQNHLLKERTLTARLHLLEEKQRLLQTLKQHLEVPAAAVAIVEGAAAAVEAPMSLTRVKDNFLRLIQLEILAESEDLKAFVLVREGWLDEDDGLARFGSPKEDDGLGIARLVAKHKARLTENFSSLKATVAKWPNENWILTRAGYIDFVGKEITATIEEIRSVNEEIDTIVDDKNTEALKLLQAAKQQEDDKDERFKILIDDPTSSLATSAASAVVSPGDSRFPSVASAAPSAPIAIVSRGRAAVIDSSISADGSESSLGAGAGAATRASSAFSRRAATKAATAIDLPSLAARLSAVYPGARVANIELILNEGLPVTVIDEADNTLLHLLLDNPLGFYNSELRLITDYLLRRGISVNSVNNDNLTPPALIVTKTYMGRDRAKLKAAELARSVFDLCTQACAFEQQEAEFSATIDRFIVEMIGHVDTYKALSEERKHDFWFPLFQSTVMNVNRAGEAKSTARFLKELQTSPYQVLDIVERIINKSQQAWKGILSGSRLHNPILQQSSQLQLTYSYRRALSTRAGVAYDYWDLMIQEHNNSIDGRLRRVREEGDRKLAEAVAKMNAQMKVICTLIGVDPSHLTGAVAASREVSGAELKAALGSIGGASSKPTVAAGAGFFQGQAVLVKSVPSIRGLCYQEIEGDGHCLFNAVALYVGQDQAQLRNRVAHHISAHLEEYRAMITSLNPRRNVDDYLTALRSGEEWADHLEIAILMKVFNRPIVIIEDDGAFRRGLELGSFTGEPIFVYYNGHNHYNAYLLAHGWEDRGREIQSSLLPTLSGVFSGPRTG